MHADALTIPLGNDAALTISSTALLRAVLKHKPTAISATVETTAEPVSIGAPVGGGIYAGMTIHDGTPQMLVLLPGDIEGKWADAQTWAKEQGGELPSRFDLLVLWANLKHEFQKRAYWSNSQVAGYDAYAWIQHFHYGGQDGYDKDWRCRARAVRRSPIWSL